MGRAIMLHLFGRGCCVVHHATSTASMSAFVHLVLTTRVFAKLDVIFFGASPPIGFSPIGESTLHPIVRAVDGKEYLKPWCYLQQLDCQTTKSWRCCAGSTNFGSGIRSMRNVTAW